jgi:formylglycine-generating enzyme required for sulfatase activity
LIKETERNLAILRSIKTLKTIGTRPAAEFWEEVAKTAIPSKLAKEMAVELGDGVKMEFVLIPAGSFIMGAHNCTNATPHKVTITKPFYMGKYEVTQEQWEKVMGDNPSQFKGAKNPVDTVTWLDCQRFIEKWKDKVQGHAFRLPTEAEWEYACRAGSTADYYYGYDQDKLGDYAWFKDNSGEQTHPVGQKKSNAWGLYDIQGNVREWCEDWYGNYDSNEGTDPVGPSSGSIRVVRGGSWDINATLCRSSHRRYATPSSRHSYDGLRVVVEAR